MVFGCAETVSSQCQSGACSFYCRGGGGWTWPISCWGGKKTTLLNMIYCVLSVLTMNIQWIPLKHAEVDELIGLWGQKLEVTYLLMCETGGLQLHVWQDITVTLGSLFCSSLMFSVSRVPPQGLSMNPETFAGTEKLYLLPVFDIQQGCTIYHFRIDITCAIVTLQDTQCQSLFFFHYIDMAYILTLLEMVDYM